MILRKIAMARVKVYLPTFRRQAMLPRAVNSLLKQTFVDWQCEIHNDDPEDLFPGLLVVKTRDPRIRIVNHPKNLGGAATMNAFYAPAKEEFVSILEDDNWWEPEFLEEMLRAAEKHPHVTVFWSNMKIWQEQVDGSFTFTGKTTYPEKPGKMYEEFWWPDERQIFGAIHSNGACLIRSRPGGDYRIPEIPLSANIELFRERLFPQPLVLVKAPLANFSLTLQTNRHYQNNAWGYAMALSAATFFKHAGWPVQKMKHIFEEGRKKTPPATHAYLNAACLEPKLRILFDLANWREIIRWIGSLIRRPKLLIYLIKGKKAHPEWWEFLDKNTGKQFLGSQQRVVGNVRH